MKQLNIHYIFIAVIFLSSCELQKEIDYENIENYVPKIIVNGTVGLEDGVNIIVKKTTSPSNVNENDILSEVAVFLYKSKTDSIALKREGDYLFSLDSIPYVTSNQQYLLKVRADNLDEIHSDNQEVLPMPVIDSLEIIDSFPKRLKVYFNNEYEENQAYSLEILSFINGKIDTFAMKEGVYDIIDNIKKGTNTVERNINSFSESDSLRIELHLLSKDLVQYVNSVKNYEGSVEDPFYPQPFLVYSNINGGYGIFGADSYSSVVLEINQ